MLIQHGWMAEELQPNPHQKSLQMASDLGKAWPKLIEKDYIFLSWDPSSTELSGKMYFTQIGRQYILARNNCTSAESWRNKCCDNQSSLSSSRFQQTQMPTNLTNILVSKKGMPVGLQPPFLGEGKHWTKWSQGSLERQPSAASQAQVVAAIGGTRPDRALKSSCETVLRQACEVEGFTVWRFFGVQRCEGVVFCCGPCYLTCFVYFFRANVFGWMNRRGVGVDHRPSDGGKTYFCMENWMVLECFGWVHHQVDVFFHWCFWVTENICWPRFWESWLGGNMPINFSIWSVRLDLVYNGIWWISGYPWYHRLDTFADLGCLYHHLSSNLRAFRKCTQWVNYMNFRSGFLKSVSVWGVVQHKGP